MSELSLSTGDLPVTPVPAVLSGEGISPEPKDAPDYSPGRAAPRHVGLRRREAAHAAARGESGRRRAGATSVLIWLFSILAILLSLQYFVPKIVEETQYAAARGRQRAEYEQSGVTLKDQPLKELSRAYQMVSQRVGPSVVHINITGNDDEQPADEVSHLFGPHRRESHGQGSGVIVDEAGYILTNYHVVKGSSEIKVGLSDGRSVKGQVVGVDALTDLAVIRVKADKLVAAEWGDSDELHVGALVWAVGSPFGLQRTITSGILSAKNRAGMGSVYQDFLQTDAAVNPGNSGGPLVDENGRIIGINTAIVGQTYQGISFAIPSSIAQEVYQRLRTEGHYARGWLGIALDSVSEERAKQLGMTEAKGAYVQQVVEDRGVASPAKLAGVRAGDVVVSWNDRKIDSPTTLSRAVAQTEIGSTARVVVIREGQEKTLEVTVGLRPQQMN
jgi:serine protease Do